MKTKELYLNEVKRMLYKAHIDVKEGHAYHLYTCGHIFDKEDDLRTAGYLNDSKGHSRPVRICPTCKKKYIKAGLLTKYIRCNCGSERIGLNIQPSRCCDKCPTWLREMRYGLDTSKRYCVHKPECMIIYAHDEILPCKYCSRYTPC